MLSALVPILTVRWTRSRRTTTHPCLTPLKTREVVVAPSLTLVSLTDLLYPESPADTWSGHLVTWSKTILCRSFDYSCLQIHNNCVTEIYFHLMIRIIAFTLYIYIPADVFVSSVSRLWSLSRAS